MGCFLVCFGGAKDRKRRRRAINRTLPSDYVHEVCKSSSSPQKQLEVTDGSTGESGEKLEQESLNGARKKVTFNLEVKTYEVALDPSKEDEEKEVQEELVEPKNSDGKPATSLQPFPLNHRYGNCASCDDDDIIDEEDEEYNDSDFDGEDDDVGLEGNEESYESFFSLPVEKEPAIYREVNNPKPLNDSSPGRELTILPKGSARDRSQYVNSVLNPVENTSQWKEIKDRATPSKHAMKENLNCNVQMMSAFSPEPTFKFTKSEKPSGLCPSTDYCAKQEVSVDASLSNWLVSPVVSVVEAPQQSNSYQSNSSTVSREEQPILGALTVEDLKHSSVSSSPRRLPSRSPDETPILGTVGSYWNSENTRDDSAKGVPNTTSKYREDKRVNWYSTPFEVRLERAMKMSDADEAC